MTLKGFFKICNNLSLLQTAVKRSLAKRGNHRYTVKQLLNKRFVYIRIVHLQYWYDIDSDEKMKRFSHQQYTNKQTYKKAVI